MNLSAIVSRLESIPGMTGKVIVGIPAQMESIAIAPYVWITSVVESGSESPIVGPVRQRVQLRVELTVGARNLADMNSIRDQVWAKILNFKPDNDYDPMVFRVGRMEFGDPGWFLWRDEFLTAYYRDTQ